MTELNEEATVNEIEQEVQEQQEQVSIPHIPPRPTRHSPQQLIQISQPPYLLVQTTQ